MAIKIPSKNIYSIKNPKIRDNAIDNITIGYNKVAPRNEFDKTIYGQRYESPSISSQTTHYISIDYSETKQTLNSPQDTVRNAVGTNYRIGYSVYNIVINKQLNNEIINKIIFDKDGIKNIGLNINFDKTTYSCSDKYYPNSNSFAWKPTLIDIYKNNQENDYGYNFDYKYSVNNDRKVDHKHFFFDTLYNQEKKECMVKLLAETSFFELGYGSGQIRAFVSNVDGASFGSTNEQLNEKDGVKFYNFEDAYIEEYEDRYEIKNVWVISQIEAFVLYAHIMQSNAQWNSEYIANGYAIYLNCNQLELTFSGNTIGISTEDNTITIGSGNTPLSIDGNELLQDENSLEDKYNTTLDLYGSGKETATVLCTIDDYYDYENNKLTISANDPNAINTNNYTLLYNATFNKGTVTQVQSDSATKYVFQIQSYNGEEYNEELGSITIDKSQRVHLPFYKYNDFTHIRFKLNGAEIDTAILFDVSNLEDDRAYSFSANVNIDGGQGKIYWDEMSIIRGVRRKDFVEQGLPMTFNLYDEVVPMIMRYDGKDYPLSVDASGNAKVFKVLGINIYFDGAIWQELSLQEC